MDGIHPKLNNGVNFALFETARSWRKYSKRISRNDEPNTGVKVFLIHRVESLLFLLGDIRLYISSLLMTFRLIPIYRRLDKAIDALEPFSSQNWRFDNSQTMAVWRQLSPAEQDRFPFNMKDLDWNYYLYTYIRGTLLHHLQDSFDADVRKKALVRYYR